MRKTALMVMIVMLGLTVPAPHSSIAQNQESEGQASGERDYRGPLPFYFGKLGLSESQREKLYSIQDSFDEKITELQRQIEQLEKKRDQSMESLLTPGQKLRLKELREEARRKRAQTVQETATGEDSSDDEP